MCTLSVLKIVNQLISLNHKQQEVPRKNDNGKEYDYQYMGKYIHHYLEVPKVRFGSLLDKLNYLYKYNYVTEVSLKVPLDYLLEKNETKPESSSNVIVAALIDRIELTRNRKNQVTGIRVCEVKTHKNGKNCYTTDNHRYQIRLYGLLINTLQHRYNDIFPHSSRLHKIISHCFPLNAKITLTVNHVEQIMAQRAILLQQNVIYCNSDNVPSRFTNLRTKLQGIKWILSRK